MADWREQALELARQERERETLKVQIARARMRERVCGAKLSSGGNCKRKPVKRPDLKGNGRCMRHGGLSTGPKTGPRAAKSPPDLTPVRLKYSKRARNALAASATEPIPASWQDVEVDVESPTMSSSEQGQAVAGSTVKRAQKAGQGAAAAGSGPTSPDQPPGGVVPAGGPATTPPPPQSLATSHDNRTSADLPSGSPDFGTLLGVTIGSLRLSHKDYTFRYEAIHGVPGIACHRDKARRWIALVGCVLEFGAKP